MRNKRCICWLLGILLVLGVAIPAAAQASDLTAAERSLIAQMDEAVPAAENNTLLVAAFEGGARSSEAPTWADFVEQYGDTAKRLTFPAQTKATWLDLFRAFRKKDYYILAFDADGALLPPEEYESTVIQVGQHFILTNEDVSAVYALVDVVAADDEPSKPTPTPSPAPTQDVSYMMSPMQRQGIGLVNELRSGLGIAPLEGNPVICAAAQIRADEMAATGKLAHERPDGTSPFTVFYYSPSPGGENIAYINGMDEDIPEWMQESWVTSPTHYKNMVNPEFKQMGIAYAQAPDGAWYACQLFCGAGRVILRDESTPTPSPTATAAPTSVPTMAPIEDIEPKEGSGYSFEEWDGQQMLTGPQTGPGNAYVSVEQALGNLNHPQGTWLEVINEDGAQVSGTAPLGTGMVLRLLSGNDQVRERAFCVVKGDVCGTGRVSLTQLVVMASAMNGTKELTGPYLLAGDWNNNKKIDLTDLVREARLINTGDQT